MGFFSNIFGKGNSSPTVQMGTLKFYCELYDDCSLNKDSFSRNQLAYSKRKLLQGEAKYRLVAEEVGIPWMLIGALHGLEASFNFNTCLHNGDPLPGPTTNVPKGRGPFLSWHEAAVDAIRTEDGYKKVPSDDVWTLEKMLYFAERYNGVGYLRKGVPSPYLWCGTSAYTKGKYIRDGIYSPFATSKQVGVAALLKSIPQDEIVRECFDPISPKALPLREL